MVASTVRTMEFVEQNLRDAGRIVIKVGTNLLRGEEQGLNLQMIDHLAFQFSRLRHQEKELILVSSGAVGAGAFVLGLENPPTDLSQRQALAAVGQSRLMRQYELAFNQHGLPVAQVLLTRNTFDSRELYLNARNTLETLLHWGVVPIVNENDTVAVEELKFGDNDQLSALIAGKIGAGLLILLTDVDGLYDRPPGQTGAKRIPIVYRDRDTDLVVGEDTGSRFGLGGMPSKLRAATLAGDAGILTNICGGREKNIIQRVLAGEPVGTWFEPSEKKISARKRWIAAGKTPVDATISVDRGAEAAIQSGGKSLLPSGVLEVRGNFQEGDLIQVMGAGSEPIARGLVRFSSHDLRAIQGRKSSEIAEILGPRQASEVIHRDDMVVFSGKKQE